MASSNKHWPSMFRSKHAEQPWQPQPDMSSSPPSLLSGSTTTTGCSPKLPFFSGGGDQRAPDLKPRWNPRPEQIRILEAIFNSGMLNPPRDEIPRIRMKLQEYGPVGDANVFYWFQNRKARAKSKLRAAAGRAVLSRSCAPAQREAAPPFTPPPPQQVQQQQLVVSPVAPTSSSSSSDRSSGSSKPAAQALPATAAMDLLSPLAAACQQQMHYHGQPVAPAPAPVPPTVQELVAADDLIFLPCPQRHCGSAGELAAILGAQCTHVPPVQAQQPPAASLSGMFLGLCNEVARPTSTGFGQYWPAGDDSHLGLGNNGAASNTSAATEKAHDDATKLGLLQYGFGVSAPAVDATSAAATLPIAASPPSTAVTVASVPATTAAVPYDHLQGGLAADVGFPGVAAGTVAVAWGAAVVCVVGMAGTSAMCNVPATRLDVRMCFGDTAVLVRYDGERAVPVHVDESGLTVEPLQHGAVYYCVLI